MGTSIMKVQAIINPISGSGSDRDRLRAAIAYLGQNGIEVTCTPTDGPGQGRQLARAAVESGCDAVVAVGGDGTVREICGGLAGSQLPLVIWPQGTENIVAKHFGFSPNREVLLAALRSKQHIHMDIGRANGRSFIIVVGIGFDAEVVDRLARRRTGHITHLSYVGPIWRTFWEHRFPELRVIVDDEHTWQGRGLLFVGNLCRYSLGLQVIRDAVCDDGLLDLCIMTCRHQVELLGHSWRTLRKSNIEHPKVYYRRFRRLQVESARPVPVQMDGDRANPVPLTITVEPRAVCLQVPPGGHRR